MRDIEGVLSEIAALGGDRNHQKSDETSDKWLTPAEA
jgi:hypothetical protein